MAGVEIGTLRLRGPPHLAALASFRIEDGLRTELADSRRLILIRRMRAGRRAVSARPEERPGAVRLAYEAATRDARHGRDAGDGGSVNCVWFESPAEARRLLLAELLAGRRPAGWFWRLAVPDWRGRDLDSWLAEIVARALEGGGERESLALILEVLEQAPVEIVVRAVLAAAGAPPPRPFPEHPPDPGDLPAGEEEGPPGPPAPAAALRRTVAEIRARLPGPLLERIETLARRLGPGERPVLRLLERLLMHACPSLALGPGPLTGLASAWSHWLAAPEASPAPHPERRSGPPAGSTPAAEPVPASSRQPALVAGVPRAELPAAGQAPGSAAPLPRVGEPAPPAESPLVSPRGPVSEAAGLWLVIPSLIRLGFREWLSERPLLLREDPGRTLLRTLARHHRVPEVDPALDAFEGLGEMGETPDWALCWHRGLDGWLRRRARVPVHRLVWKRGEVSSGDGCVIVRFPLEAADIRLRRRALDVDPGWVDWLGLSVRYRYEGKGR